MACTALQLRLDKLKRADQSVSDRGYVSARGRCTSAGRRTGRPGGGKVTELMIVSRAAFVLLTNAIKSRCGREPER